MDGEERLDRHRGEASVDFDFGASHKAAGGGTGEKDSGANQLSGVAESIHGGVAHDLGDTIGREDLAVLFGGEESGDEHVDPNVSRRPFAGEVFGEVVNRGFRSRIGEDLGQGNPRGG